jgi:ABC-type Mn2+/Zn2+ transport system permease subunit
MDRLLDSIGQPFFTRALLEAVLVGVLAGVTGVHVLLRRLPFFVVAMSHATFPGVVLASMLGVSLFLGGSVFGLLVVVLLVVLGLQRAVDDTGLVGVVLAGSFAVGILLQSVRSGGSKELSGFLVGSILTVTRSELVSTALVGAALLLALALTHKELVLTAFDPGGASAAGYRLRLVDLGVLALVTVALVTTIPAVGTLLAVALLTVPALTARLWTDHIPRAMLIAALVGAGSGVVGLCLSATYDIAAGGAIALTAAAAFTASYVLTLRTPRRQPARTGRLRAAEAPRPL